jgi:hypothetical protein
MGSERGRDEPTKEAGLSQAARGHRRGRLLYQHREAPALALGLTGGGTDCLGQETGAVAGGSTISHLETISGRGRAAMNPCLRRTVVGDSLAKRGCVDAWSIRLDESGLWAITTYALRLFCVLCLRRSQSHSQNQNRHECPAARGNAAVTSGVDAALCVKE